MARPHIQVILAADHIPTSLEGALRRTDATAGFWPLAEALRVNRPPRADAIVVVLPDEPTLLSGALRLLFDRLAEQPRATLVLCGNAGAVTPLPHPPILPVACFSGHDENELSARLTTMLAMRDSLVSLHRGLLTSRRSGENIARRYVNQLRLASQVQREFLPQTLPCFGPVAFNVVFRPVDYVSGDIYDVRRLDEDHVGLAVGDATGHGIPAALLTVYIKRALRGKEIENGSYRILSPDEVLSRLNDDIMEARLTECPFVTAVYAVFNIRTYEVTLARGGAPYPIYRSAAGQTQPVMSAGSVVGIVPGARFEVVRLQMQPGDSLLLHTDGLERIVAPQLLGRQLPEGLQRAAARLAAWRRAKAARALARGDQDQGESTPASAVATATLTTDRPGGRNGRRRRTPWRSRPGAATCTALTATAPPAQTHPPTEARDIITTSTWYAILRAEGPTVALEQVSNRQRALRRMGYPLDDLTLLCLQIQP